MWSGDENSDVLAGHVTSEFCRHVFAVSPICWVIFSQEMVKTCKTTPNRLQVRFGRQVRGNGRFLIPIYLDNLEYFTNLTSSAILGWLWWFTMTSQWGRDNPNNSIESQFSWLRWLYILSHKSHIVYLFYFMDPIVMASGHEDHEVCANPKESSASLFLARRVALPRWMTFDGQPKKNMLMDAMTWYIEIYLNVM